MEDLLVVLVSGGLISYLVVAEFNAFLQLEGLATLFLADKHGLVEEEGVPEDEKDGATASGLPQTGDYFPNVLSYNLQV